MQYVVSEIKYVEASHFSFSNENEIIVTQHFRQKI